MNSVVRGNLAGISALIMWSTTVGLIRSITDVFGAAAGTALIYSLGAIALLLKSGVPKVKAMPKIYLFGCGLLFVIYEIVFSQAISLAKDSQQSLEVGMLNYLWPCLTVVLSIWINKTKMYWWVWPGTALSIVGLYWCVASNGNMSLAGFLNNVYETPVPYILGLFAGIGWALYSNLSLRYSEGFNAIPLFFVFVGIMLWVNFFLQGGEIHFPGYKYVAQLLFLGAMFGFSYSMWEIGIHEGNFIFLAICSYFTPATSMLFASLWLNIIPPINFWSGVGLVIAGSLICWLASVKRNRIL